MNYDNIIKGTFIERQNRFKAICAVDGGNIAVHVKNTGRCRELLIPNATVFLEKSASTSRKTSCSLVAVMKGSRLINMDSQAPNKAVYEALISGKINLESGKITYIKPEAKYESSRFDFYVETESCKIFIEVKGVTLEKDNIAMFPDAPTERGVKHITELTKAVSDGFKAFIIFVIQMKSPRLFTPNTDTHPEFAAALKLAAAQGVTVAAYDCNVYETGMDVADKIAVVL